MTFAQMFAVIDASGLSPREGGERLGISHMTLRRWRRKPAKTKLPAAYERSFAPVLQEMLAVHPATPAAAEGVAAAGTASFRQTLKRLGFPDDILAWGPEGDRALIKGLSQVGADASHKRAVDDNTKKIGAFSTFGGAWKERISSMLAVIQSKELVTSEKLVAYGALFYLITPLDLIPDTIPVIGFLDDFAVLGVALWFYRKHFPHLRPRR